VIKKTECYVAVMRDDILVAVPARTTVEPLPIYTTRLAEIDGEIARLTAEREKLAKPTGEENV